MQSLRDQGREVIMLGVLGAVPEVTAHASTPPYNPTAGGVEDLVYRLWRDPQYPDGDVLPDEWARGVDAAYKQFEFGIGPLHWLRRGRRRVHRTGGRGRPDPQRVREPQHARGSQHAGERGACAAASSRSATTISAPRSVVSPA
ncbi:MAG: hypothetical protein U0168_31965 [Nannocystaceae bacterium]